MGYVHVSSRRRRRHGTDIQNVVLGDNSTLNLGCLIGRLIPHIIQSQRSLTRSQWEIQGNELGEKPRMVRRSARASALNRVMISDSTLLFTKGSCEECCDRQAPWLQCSPQLHDCCIQFCSGI